MRACKARLIEVSRAVLFTLFAVTCSTSAAPGERPVPGDAERTARCLQLATELESATAYDLAYLLSGLFNAEYKLLDDLQLGTMLSTPLSVKDVPCLVDEVRKTLITWQPNYSARVFLLTGKLTSPGAELLQAQLPYLLRLAEYVVYVTWKGHVSRPHWLRHTAKVQADRFKFIEVPYERYSSDVLDTLYTSYHQDNLLRSGLDAISSLFPPARGISSTDILVWKSRPDVYLPRTLIKHVLSLNSSVPFDAIGRPFFRRVWVPWADAVQPLYVADETFAACLLDMWQLGWPKGAKRPVPRTLGRGGFHVHRWLVPFLPWYPILFAYRRNAFDITERLMASLSLKPGMKAASSPVLDLAFLGLLPALPMAHLLKILALWYHLIATFFHIGNAERRGKNGDIPSGTALLMSGLGVKSMPASEDAPLELIGIRCSPTAYDFLPDNVSEIVGDESPNDCNIHGADTRAGLAHLNAASPYWTRTLYDIGWPRRMLQGQAPPDGLSERIALIATTLEPPTHYTTAAGDELARQHGRYEEEVSTTWCFDLVPRENLAVPSRWLSWERCCGHDAVLGRVRPCWKSGLQSTCCFPSEAFCPKWLGYRPLEIALQLTDHFKLWAPTHLEKLLENASALSSLTRLCDSSASARERRFRTKCLSHLVASANHRNLKQTDWATMCEIAQHSREFYQVLAPEAAGFEQLWADTGIYY